LEAKLYGCINGGHIRPRIFITKYARPARRALRISRKACRTDFLSADWSPVCGDELALFNELRDEFAKFDASLLAISVDGA
jgi:AhpC/TSA family